MNPWIGEFFATFRLEARLAFARNLAWDEQRLRALLKTEEGGTLELKSSLAFDHRRAREQPGLTIESYRAEGVTDSALKAVAGFVNGPGGVVVIGVDDEHRVLGIEHDFPFVGGNSVDRWELHLRGLIRGRFKDGATVNDRVSCAPVQCAEGIVMCIDVQPREQFAFLKVKGFNTLFVRQGNTTRQVDISEMQDLIEARLARRSSHLNAAR